MTGRKTFNLFFFAGLATTACVSPVPPDPVTDGFDRLALLSSIETNVIRPAHQHFESTAQDLVVAIDGYKTALDTSTTAPSAALSLAQEAWRNTMLAWQHIEVMQVGPVGAKGRRVGGESIRDEVFSWPTTNSCRVDQEIVRQKYSEPNFILESLVMSYGLDALEYLMFVHAVDNTCPSLVDINEQGLWAALTPTEIENRRAVYAHGIAMQVAFEASRIVRLWSDSFSTEFVQSGSKGSVYKSPQEALDELFAAVFYLELVVKDRKLALPAALSADCKDVSCPDKLESRWALHSRENILANLEAFKTVFVGGDEDNSEHIGFDDFLAKLGAASLSAEILASLDFAIGLIKSQTTPYKTALMNQQTDLVQAHDAVKQVTDLLKTKFVSILSLEIPNEGAGDSD